MKFNMKNGLAIAAFVFSAQMAFAQNTEVRKITGFERLSVSGNFDVTLIAGSEEKIEITADADDMENIKTEKEDGKLRIYKKNGWSFFGSGDNETVKIKLTYKNLNEISASASATVFSQNVVKANVLELNSSSAGDLRLNVEAAVVKCEVSSGADAVLSGKVGKLEVESSSGGEVKADELEAGICVAEASSGAAISINVTQELDAEASSGADIKYKGNPQKVNTNSSSGGDVRKKKD